MMTNEELSRLNVANVPMQARVQAIFDGTCALRSFIEASILPLLGSMIQRSSHEDAIAGTYYRLTAWMKGLADLGNPIHIQVACAAARSMFELLLDIKQLIADPSLADAYHDFTFVRRFRNAQLLVEHFDRQSGADPTKLALERAFINDTANKARCDAVRLKHWGRDRKGKLIWPEHWNNVDAASRARQVGQDYLDIHREAYGRLCWYIHAGGVGIGGLSADGISAGFAWAHGLCQNFAFEASEEMSKAFHFFDADGTLRDGLNMARLIPGKSLAEALVAAIDSGKSSGKC